MSTATEHATDTHAEHGAEHHAPTDGYFIKVALILAVVTALETSTYWWPDSMKSYATARIRATLMK